MALDLSIVTFLYVLGGLVLVFGLWLWYDRRDQREIDEERAKVLFHCIKCSRVYAEAPALGSAPCPDCNHPNLPLKF